MLFVLLLNISAIAVADASIVGLSRVVLLYRTQQPAKIQSTHHLRLWCSCYTNPLTFTLGILAILLQLKRLHKM